MGKYHATWRHGKAITGRYVFDDGLPYTADGEWEYCRADGDRRFYSELVTGLRPAGDSQICDTHPPPQLPLKSWDARCGHTRRWAIPTRTLRRCACANRTRRCGRRRTAGAAERAPLATPGLHRQIVRGDRRGNAARRGGLAADAAASTTGSSRNSGGSSAPLVVSL
eukprot:5518658-Prymnesium_polylepis.1